MKFNIISIILINLLLNYQYLISSLNLKKTSLKSKHKTSLKSKHKTFLKSKKTSLKSKKKAEKMTLKHKNKNNHNQCWEDYIKKEQKTEDLGHYEKIKVQRDEYVYVPGDAPSGIPGAFLVSKNEAEGRQKNLLNKMSAQGYSFE